jgi:hypothetical protein
MTIKLSAAHRLKASVDTQALDEFTDLVKCLDSVKWQRLEDEGFFDNIDACCVPFDHESYDALIKRLQGEGYKVVGHQNAAETIHNLEGCDEFSILGYGSGARCPLVVGRDSEKTYLYMPTDTDDVQSFINSLG